MADKYQRARTSRVGLVHENQDALRLPHDIWDDTGDSIAEHVAGVDDFEAAEATYRATNLVTPQASSTDPVNTISWILITPRNGAKSLSASAIAFIQVRWCCQRTGHGGAAEPGHSGYCQKQYRRGRARDSASTLASRRSMRRALGFMDAGPLARSVCPVASKPVGDLVHAGFELL